MSDGEKKKQKPKKGKVFRIPPDLVEIIAREQRADEPSHETIRRLFGDTTGWVLPADLHSRIEDARGAAVVRAVRGKSKKIEKPIAVKVTK